MVNEPVEEVTNSRCSPSNRTADTMRPPLTIAAALSATRSTTSMLEVAASLKFVDAISTAESESSSSTKYADQDRSKSMFSETARRVESIGMNTKAKAVGSTFDVRTSRVVMR